MIITNQKALEELLKRIGNDDALVTLVMDGEELPDGIEVNYDPEENKLLIEPNIVIKYAINC